MKVIKNKKYAYFSLAMLIAGTLLYLFPPHFAATNAKDCGDATTCEDSQESVWSVNVEETLSVTVTPPLDPSAGENEAKGDVDTFLRNKVNLSVSSNNGKGFTAGMTTEGADTSLAHLSEAGEADGKDTIPTLGAASVKSAFPTNFWGYSLDDTEPGKDDSNYKALVANTAAPITVLSSPTNATQNKDIYFGAKANKSKLAGTYKGTVVFTVTSETDGKDLGGGTGDEPSPEGPSADTPSAEDGPSIAPTYAYTTNNRTYRAASSNGEPVAIVENTKKKQTTLDNYVSPLGVQDKTYTNVQSGSIITTILMIIALIAAVIGFFFFIIAKRRKEEEDEEEIQ